MKGKNGKGRERERGGGTIVHWKEERRECLRKSARVEEESFLSDIVSPFPIQIT